MQQNSQQATMQVTSETIWNFITSDQSLAGSHPLQIEKMIHDTIYTIKQAQVTMQATRLNIQGITTSDQSLAGRTPSGH